MQGTQKLERTFDLTRTYSRLYADYCSTGVMRVLDASDKEFSGSEEHYFDVGADAIRIITSSLITNLRDVPATILDFPCGSGRVTRHLKAFFVNSEITACDLYTYHVDFCRDTFNVNGVYSKANLDEVDFGKKFDLIFCGSLVTHLPEPQFISAMNLITRSLSETGLAIITLHGRHSIFIQYYKWKYIADDQFSIAQREFESRGFGYVDYDRNFLLQSFDKQDRYGITLLSPAYFAHSIEKDEGVRLLGYQERGWDNHQDVAVIGKPPLNFG